MKSVYIAAAIENLKKKVYRCKKQQNKCIVHTCEKHLQIHTLAAAVSSFPTLHIVSLTRTLFATLKKYWHTYHPAPTSFRNQDTVVFHFSYL